MKKYHIIRRNVINILYELDYSIIRTFSKYRSILSIIAEKSWHCVYYNCLWDIKWKQNFNNGLKKFPIIYDKEYFLGFVDAFLCF